MKHVIVAAILVIVVTALVILGLNAIDLVPQLASEEGRLVDQMFTVQIYVIAFIFSLIIVLYALQRRGLSAQAGRHGRWAAHHGQHALEITWTVIPLIIVMGFGIWGAGHLSEITASASRRTGRRGHRLSVWLAL